MWACWIAEYCPESTSVGKWKTRGGAAGDFTYKYLLTMACDPVNRCLVSVGDGEVYFYDINNPDSGVTRALAATTGDNAVVGVANPGVEYDPVTGRVIAWGSGRAVYSLDVQSRVWTRIDAGGADPGSPNMNGTFGRFRYSPAHNVFVLVNTTTTNVFVYRHTAGTGLAEAGVARRALMALDARPNPFQGRTRFMLKGGVAGPVEFRIFDFRGRLTDRVRADGPELAQGVEWDASGLPAGLYAVQCRAGKNVFQTTVLLAR